MIESESNFQQLREYAIPERVSIEPGRGGMPKISISTDHSTAEIYPHGAQVTGFQKTGDAPLLFLSGSSQFIDGKAIRGGVPIVFPWFGPRPGAPAHGFGRLTSWDLCETGVTSEGGVLLRFELPQSVAKVHGLDARVHYVVTVSDTLTMELIVANASSDALLSFESCLHTYFEVGDIGAVSITGLKGHSYLDHLDAMASKVEAADQIRVSAEVDRTYLEATGPVEIHDASLHRVICIEKSGSRSTVVWNPWLAKSRAMADFGDEEYLRMVCVESGNVADNRVTVEPGNSASLKVVLSSRPE